MKKSYLTITISALLLASCSQPNNENVQENSSSIQQNQAVKQPSFTSIDKNEDFLAQIRSGVRYQGARALNTNDISILLNGMNLQLSPAPIIKNQTIYIPLSAVSTYFEVGVDYNKESDTIGIHKGDQNIDFAIDSPSATINGKTERTKPAIKQGENIYVPVDFIGKALGYHVVMNIDVKKAEIGNSKFSTLSAPDTSLQILSTKQQYTVVAGDSLSLIAKKHNTTVEELKQLNNLSSDLIKVGQTLAVSSQVQQKTHTVVKGDTLYSISKKYNTSVDAIKKLNKLTTDTLSLGQTLIISGQQSETSVPTPQQTEKYTVVAGDTLYSIAKRFNLAVDELRKMNNLSSDVLSINQTLTISGKGSTPDSAPAEQTKQYKVVAGDTLYGIAKRFNTTPEDLRKRNNLTSDILKIGQTLTISGSGSGATEQPSKPAPTTTKNGVTVKYITHTIKSGDNAWNLSVKYGVPMLELLKLNKLSLNSSLSIGQKLQVPVYDVPVKSVVSSKHGELLDWWTEGRYVFPIGKTATITDFKTGRTFKVKHTMGGNHADAEPLTSTDAKIMKEVWGGSYSWTPRAVIISVDGRKLAAAMHSYPHADYDIKNNNYNGHFCIHFLNSTRHNDGLVQDSMQKQVKIAAGVN